MCLNNCILSEDIHSSYDPLDTDVFGKFEDTCDYMDIESTANIGINTGDLIIMQLNSRGLIGKQSQLSRLLYEIMGDQQIDILIICGTWLTKESEQRLHLPGYNYYGCHRKNNKGEGVGFLISEGLSYKSLNNLDKLDDCVESIFIEIELNTGKALLGSLYRPPNNNPQLFLEYYDELCKSIKSGYKNVIIGLDHNLNLLNHHNHKDTQKFLETLLENDQFPCITRPTRITHHSATLIDNIIVSSNLHFKQNSGIILSDLSDHMPCISVLKNVLKGNKKRSVVKKRNLSEKK